MWLHYTSSAFFKLSLSFEVRLTYCYYCYVILHLRIIQTWSKVKTFWLEYSQVSPMVPLWIILSVNISFPGRCNALSSYILNHVCGYYYCYCVFCHWSRSSCKFRWNNKTLLTKKTNKQANKNVKQYLKHSKLIVVSIIRDFFLQNITKWKRNKILHSFHKIS